ncbi:MAG TPA: hypothetical protein VK809_05540 [Bacteroidia bacterium]|nr:hypothetical protein [Bacteroidia bacterium]
MYTVSLLFPVLPERAGENTAIGGFEPITLKKLNGARLGLPKESIVLAKHIGRGPTEDTRWEWSKFCGISEGEMESILFGFYGA